MATVKGRRGRDRVRGGLVVMAMFLALAFSSGQVVHAAGLSVTNCNPSGAGSLASAVATANTNAQADTITITATCTGASAVNPGATLVLSETGTTIALAGASAGFVVSGGGTRTVLQVNTGVTATISGITITGGRGATGTTGTAGANGADSPFTLETGGNGGNGGNGGVGGAGGIANSGALTLTNTTMSGNTGAVFGGGGGSRGLGGAVGSGSYPGNPGTPGSNPGGGGGGVVNAGGTVTVRGTILAGNTGGDYAGATVTDNGRNLVGAASGGATFTGTGTQTGVTNPQLGPLADNGGPTQTRPPAPTSPAVNTGAATCNVTYTDAVTGMPVTLTTDQRGVPRPQGSACDIGAVEARLTAVVNNTGDGAADATRCNDPAASTCRLRDAIAATDAGGTITFAAPLFAMPQTITLDPTQGQLTLAENVTITGPGAAALTVARSTAIDTPQFRIFLVNSGVTATISGLTITGGDVHLGGNAGGGILSNGALTITNAAVTNNFAGGNGGGIQQSGSTLTVTNTTVSGNSAYNIGGGIGQGTGTSALTNVTVSDNGASYGSGIGLIGGTSTLTNVTVSGNNAQASGGGGIYNGGTLNATRTIVAGNTNGDFYGTGFNGTNVANLVGGTPLLAPLGNYGGPTQTRLPLPGSPALDAGGAGCTGTDQRGVSRPQGSACDIGAVEIRGYTLTPTAGSTPQTASINTQFANRLEVTFTETGGTALPGVSVAFTATTAMSGASATLSTPNPITTDANGRASVQATANGVAGGYSVTANGGGVNAMFSLTNNGVVCVVNSTLDPTEAGKTTLRNAVTLANSGNCTNDTITFDATTFATPQTITLTQANGGTLTLSHPVTIDGTGRRVTISGGGGVQVFRVNGGTTAALTALTVTGGSGIVGGGIDNNGGTLTLTNVTLSGNTASTGGGINNDVGGTLTLVTSTVSGNTATTRGGGILNNGMLTAIVSSTVAGNTAPNGTGSGIASGSGTVNVTGSIVAGNANDDNLAGSINAPPTRNVTTGNPLLAPLGYYGGGTNTQPPLPGSPALDLYLPTGGNNCGTMANPVMTDQRGLAGPVNTNCDAGAVESRGFVFSLPGGGNQRTGVGTAFPTALTVTVTGNTVTGSIREPVDGGVVAFTGPMMGASIAPNPTTATIPTTGAIGDGIASPAVTANGTAGGPYTVTASAGGATGGATYSLTNAPIVASASPSSGGVNGGSLVTITGAGFVPGTTVTIGGTTVALDTITATTLTFRTPAHASGTVDVIVTASGIGTTKTGAYIYGVVNSLPPPQPSVPANGIPNPRPAPQPSAPVIGTPAPLPPSR